jgi:dihydroflavonol-4-reductase
VTVGFGPLHAPGDESTPLDPGPIYGHSGALRTYHDSKLASEAMTVAAGGVVVNPDYVLGAWDVKPTSGQLLLTIGKSRWVPLHPRGGKCFIDADDCAVGHLAAMERGAPGRRYLLGNHNVSYRDFMGACAEVTGRPKPRVAVPNVALRAAGAVGRALSRVDVHRFAGLEPHLLLAMQQERYRSGRRSWDELGVPRTELRVTIEKAWRWFVDHGYTA